MTKELTPPIEIDIAALGPAMLALTERQRNFVWAKVRGGLNNKEAARAAGYSATSENSLAVMGFSLAHDERLQAAISEQGRRVLLSEGPNSIRTLIEIRDDKRVKPADRIKAAVAILDRSGLHAISETINHNIETHLTVSQKDQRILQLCAELGISPDEARKMLIQPGDGKVIDAAYEDVPDQAATAAEPPAEMTEAEKKEQAARRRRNDLKRQKRTSTPEQWEAHKAAQREERIRRAKADYEQSQQQDDNPVDDLSDIY